eukprot:UN00560
MEQQNGNNNERRNDNQLNGRRRVASSRTVETLQDGNDDVTEKLNEYRRKKRSRSRHQASILKNNEKDSVSRSLISSRPTKTKQSRTLKRDITNYEEYEEFPALYDTKEFLRHIDHNRKENGVQPTPALVALEQAYNNR